MVPVLRVAPDGKPLGFVDFDGTMKRVLERFGEMLPKDDLSQKQFAAVQAMIAQPAFRTMIKKQGYYFWEGWVSMWLGARGLRVGKPQEWTARLPGPFGGMHEHPGKRELVALDPEREGGVQLRARARGESSQLLEAVLQQWVGLLPEQMRERAPKKPFDKVELELEVEVWTDPRTLIPRKAHLLQAGQGDGPGRGQVPDDRRAPRVRDRDARSRARSLNAGAGPEPGRSRARSATQAQPGSAGAARADPRGACSTDARALRASRPAARSCAGVLRAPLRRGARPPSPTRRSSS
jgi:hypothetical protein